MNLAISKTRCTIGVKAHAISVEVHLSNGIPAFNIVGLPEAAVKESKERVRSAIINSQFQFPYRRITVNLAPADLPKIGSGFDLPIAIGILAASQQIPLTAIAEYEFVGELALDGQLRGISAIIPMVLAAREAKQSLIIPLANAHEAGIASHAKLFCVDSLPILCEHLHQNTPIAIVPPTESSIMEQSTLDWSDVRGQHHAKFAMKIAACGGHSILLSGPPGSGKTMLAKRFINILPDLSDQQALECASIYSISNQKPNYHAWRRPAFRSPHHTASSVALVGGGNPPRPGEISLAHHGVLFLDELPEFQRHALETLREPLESGTIYISRAARQIEFPAQFQLIAAMNPCPCGHTGNTQTQCECSPNSIKRYLGKLSGPLLDRIDILVNVHAIAHHELTAPRATLEPENLIIQALVKKIRNIQIARQGRLNAHLTIQQCELFCTLSAENIDFITMAIQHWKLSARAYHRLLKVARTIADIREDDNVQLPDLQQALSFREQLQTTH